MLRMTIELKRCLWEENTRVGMIQRGDEADSDGESEKEERCLFATEKTISMLYSS